MNDVSLARSLAQRDVASVRHFRERFHQPLNENFFRAKSIAPECQETCETLSPHAGYEAGCGFVEHLQPKTVSPKSKPAATPIADFERYVFQLVLRDLLLVGACLAHDSAALSWLLKLIDGMIKRTLARRFESRIVEDAIGDLFSHLWLPVEPKEKGSDTEGRDDAQQQAEHQRQRTLELQKKPRRIESYRGRSQFSTWLVGVATNLALAVVRVREQVSDEDLDVADPHTRANSPSPAASANSANSFGGMVERQHECLRQAIQQAIRDMTPREREVVVMLLTQSRPRSEAEQDGSPAPPILSQVQMAQLLHVEPPRIVQLKKAAFEKIKRAARPCLQALHDETDYDLEKLEELLIASLADLFEPQDNDERESL